MSPPIDMTRFEQLRASGDLPSPKGVALAVIGLTRKQEVSIAELARVISGDPAFVGRLIKAANGLVALSRRPVASVPEALMVLGLPAVRTMVLGFSLLSHYRGGACRHFDYNGYWSSSLALALAMQVFAERTRVGAPDELFSAGLLARVGELALATLYPADYDRVLEQAQRPGEARLADLEERSFALSHCELTAAMLADWGLPRIFVDAIRCYEDIEALGYPEGARQRMLLQSLVVARQVSALCLSAPAERASLMPRLVADAERLGIGRADLAADWERIGRLWEEWTSMLQIDHAPPPPFDEIVEERTAQPEPPAERQSAAAAPAGVAGKDLGASPRVVIVDDEGRTRAALRKALEQAGYDVYEAADGRQGMERALELQPQIMVLDWTLPELSGLELLRALRQTRVGQGIYVVILTHSDDEEHLVAAFECGADDFIAKPLRPRVLVARLRAGLRVVRLQQELEREHDELHHFAAELAVSNRRLQEAALTDALTGFPNRRYAIDRIEKEWQAATRSGRPLACMIIDLDNFKQINDTHGHDAGDEVLRRAADALRRALRGQDVICRTGGDEFLAICPETDLARALICAERLRAALDRLRVTAGDGVLVLSASIGVATRDAAMPGVDALMKQADLGAYRAKQLGRNCVASTQLRDPADAEKLPLS